MVIFWIGSYHNIPPRSPVIVGGIRLVIDA